MCVAIFVLEKKDTGILANYLTGRFKLILINQICPLNGLDKNSMSTIVFNSGKVCCKIHCHICRHLAQKFKQNLHDNTVFHVDSYSVVGVVMGYQ